jgi:hypothetical protein
MLVLYTAFDPITAVLADCARKFLARHPGAATGVLDPNSPDWHAPHPWVGMRPNKPLLFFGHGIQSPAAFVSQIQTAFLDASVNHLLANRFICGICCFSDSVGQGHANLVGATLVGYDGYLLVNTERKYADLLSSCILAGLDQVVNGRTARDVLVTTYKEYLKTEQDLYSGTADDCVAAPLFRGNAKTLSLAGSPHRTP